MGKGAEVVTLRVESLEVIFAGGGSVALRQGPMKRMPSA